MYLEGSGGNFTKAEKMSHCRGDGMLSKSRLYFCLAATWIAFSNITFVIVFFFRKERTLDSVFNSSGYQQISENTFSEYFGLEQAFWTIVDQYPTDSVDSLR